MYEELKVPTLDGKSLLRIPPGTQAGQKHFEFTFLRFQRILILSVLVLFAALTTAWSKVASANPSRCANSK